MSVRDERGSALMLMPAAVLVLVVLGAIAVDFAIVYLGERELSDLAAAAANDAVVVAIDEAHFYRCGQLRLIDAEADQAARRVRAARTSDAVRAVAVDARVGQSAGVPSVTVEATGSVDLIFSPALPGGPGQRQVGALATAVAERGGAVGPAGPGCAGG